MAVKRETDPKVVVRHHEPEVPDTAALERAREIWARGLVRRFRELARSGEAGPESVKAPAAPDPRLSSAQPQTAPAPDPPG